MKNILKAILKANENGLAHFGIRGDDRVLEVGTHLDNSFDWDCENDCQSEEKLNGTCTTGFGYMWLTGEDDEDDLETIVRTIEYHKKSYNYNNLYIVAGTDIENGSDENEVIISGAEIIYVL